MFTIVLWATITFQRKGADFMYGTSSCSLCLPLIHDREMCLFGILTVDWLLFIFFRGCIPQSPFLVLILPVLQTFLSPEKKWVSEACPYLSTLVSARRLFMMPRAPTPPENPFWREVEPDWRGCPMAISESCFCMMARFTCGRRGGREEMKRDEAIGQTRRRSLAAWGKSVIQSAGVVRIWFYRCDTRLAGGVFPSPEEGEGSIKLEKDFLKKDWTSETVKKNR